MKEHEPLEEVFVSDDCEVACYCISCGRCIYEADRSTSEVLFDADNHAFDHWDSFSRHHTIIIANLNNGEYRVMDNTGVIRNGGDQD